MRLRESPTFIVLEKHEQISEHPLREIFGHSLPSVLRGIGLRMAENGGSYLFNSLAVAYATGTVMVDRSIGPIAVAVGSLIGMVSVPLTGHISDQLGRLPVYRFGAVVMVLLAFPGWYLISLGHAWLVIVVIALGIGFGVNTMLGPQCAMLPEMFGNKHRYLGVAVSREFSAVIAGGLAGVLGAALIAEVRRLVGAARHLHLHPRRITLATTFIATETRGRDLHPHRGCSRRQAGRICDRSMNPFDLTGTTALVTGSSRGIGLALAKGLLQAGSRVTIHGRNLDQATATARSLAEETGGETRVSTFDVTDHDAVDRGIAEIEQEWGTPDILVNNAGIQRRAPFTEFTLQDWNDLVATNLTSAFLVSQRVARGMVDTRQRQDHQHRIGAEPARPARDRAVQRHQGRHRHADQGPVCRPRSEGDPDQRAGPGLLRDRTDQGPGRERRVHAVGDEPDSRRPLGQCRRPGRGAGLPGLTRLELRQRTGAVRRRRHDGRGLMRIGRLDTTDGPPRQGQTP